MYKQHHSWFDVFLKLTPRCSLSPFMVCFIMGENLFTLTDSYTAALSSLTDKCYVSMYLGYFSKMVARFLWCHFSLHASARNRFLYRNRPSMSRDQQRVRYKELLENIVFALALTRLNRYNCKLDNKRWQTTVSIWLALFCLLIVAAVWFIRRPTECHGHGTVIAIVEVETGQIHLILSFIICTKPCI